MMTRDEYIKTPAVVLPNGKLDKAANMARHRAYYAQFVDAGTIAHVVHGIGSDALLASTDEHLNDVTTMRNWDAVGAGAPRAIRFDTVGDYPTPAGIVCVIKEAARQWIEQQRA